jgi:lipopolysaccharide transport system permease protein
MLYNNKMTVKGERTWDWTISSKTSYWNESLKVLWSYRHFLVSLVRKNFLLNYQQTILGPAWMIFQPIVTLVIYVVVFGKVVGVSTGSVPPVLFYFAGIVLWNFFSETFNETSATFRANAQVFSKVYFPRIIIPISDLITQFLRFLIQFVFLLLVITYYLVIQKTHLSISWWFFTFPLSVCIVGGIALGMGMIFSVLTAKYRDMINFGGLIVRLLMFLTPVIYPLATVSKEFRWVVLLNPLTPLFELFKIALLGEGVFMFSQFIYSLVFMFFILMLAILLFNKQGDKLIDVI